MLDVLVAVELIWGTSEKQARAQFEKDQDNGFRLVRITTWYGKTLGITGEPEILADKKIKNIKSQSGVFSLWMH
jgi:hypothetical protein